MLVCEVSFEVCNKVGGIYTVITSKVSELQQNVERYIAIGPWFKNNESSEFEQAHIDNVPPEIQVIFDELRHKGIACTYGHWNIPGKPETILIDTSEFTQASNNLKSMYWDAYKIDSIHSRWDFEEPMLFATAAGMVIEKLNTQEEHQNQVVGQFHEWMCGFGGLYLKHKKSTARVVFTTHATVLGRTLTSNNIDIEHLPADFDDLTYAKNQGVIEKHTAEKASAHYADAFTTVSHITKKEAAIMLEKEPDALTFNGIDMAQFPQGKQMFERQFHARAKLIAYLTNRFPHVENTTPIIYTSGRPEFKNKGFDTLMTSLEQVQKHVVCIFFVPWKHYEANTQGVCSHDTDDYPLTQIYNDAAIPANVTVLLYPVYLENSEFGNYYDTVAGCDLGVFPSRYEPWGYTPMESCALGVPCITTTRTGFGEFCNQFHKNKISQGVAVFDATKNSDAELESKIASTIDLIAGSSEDERILISLRTQKIALICQWKSFIKRYLDIYTA
jgi:phosphorylase/glycogen(starch) synthase